MTEINDIPRVDCNLENGISRLWKPIMQRYRLGE
jgi:hypothetical protein